MPDQIWALGGVRALGLEARYMNVLDVHAIGWVATRDLAADSVCKLVGLASRFDIARLGRLAACWATLRAAVADDQYAAGFAARLMQPRRVPLSTKSVAALGAFVQELTAAAPGLYSRVALRERCLTRAVQFLGSMLCGVALAHYASPATPSIGAATISFFVAAFWSLATAAQLFIAYRIVGSLASQKAPGPQLEGDDDRRRPLGR
ncbi:MAG: hypothetical protein IT518_05185 [Burkholderiales bacterium]|nr:hypothetical protein [Burkholderiales bacterium]